MIVDVSHVSDETVSDVLALLQAPIIASHSCARAVFLTRVLARPCFSLVHAWRTLLKFPDRFTYTVVSV